MNEDYKLMYELASRDIRTMVAGGACIPGVVPRCPCPHCPDASACVQVEIRDVLAECPDFG